MGNRLSDRHKKRPQSDGASFAPRTVQFQGALIDPTRGSIHTPLAWPSSSGYDQRWFYSSVQASDPPPDFSIWVVAYMEMHANVFGDVSKNLAASLRQLGYRVEETWGSAPSKRGGRTIVFGANVLRDPSLIPRDAIIYQLEQVGSRWMNETYMGILKSHITWDFSSHNAAEIRKRGCHTVHVCRVGSQPQAIVPTQRTKDIDVLFYGSANPRRKKVLDRLRTTGLLVHDGGSWGSALDDLIARSKVVLNIHYYPDAVLEMVRVSYALERGACIVTEAGADPDLERLLDSGIVVSPYDQLVDAVSKVVRWDQSERHAMAQRGYNAFRAFSYKDEIDRCLKSSLPQMRGHRVKCFINNRDRLTWTKAIVGEIERLGGEPIIVDNDSTYPALLEWYETKPCRVIRLSGNAGARAPWISGVLEQELKHGEAYVVTDPDLDLSGVPADALSVLESGLKHGTRKVGLSLEINDVPRQLLDVPQINGRTLEQIEQGYWQERLDAQFFRAQTDTTFAMYRYAGRVPMDHSFFSGVRADRPYTARHLPWYRTPKDFDEEDRYYVAHRLVTGVNGTWYDSVQKAEARQ